MSAAAIDTHRSRRASGHAHPHRSLHYRPALDGLRAIAVLAVFLYHARPEWLPGGWLGVDVFFVLSGFLITSLLLTEHNRWGWISFSGFWLARARRLLPALLLCLLVVLLVAGVWLPPSRRESLGMDALATALYVANWRFLVSDEAYFAAIAVPSPLRHAWSLAIEEQFYVIFPILLALILAKAGRRWLPWALTGLVVLSSSWMAYLHEPGIDPSRVYYGTDTRAFELLIGSVLAAVLSPGATGRRQTRMLIDLWSRRLALAVLASVLAAFLLVSASSPGLFEGGLVLFALAVGVIVVAAASPNPSRVAVWLGHPILRNLGKISYGVYLWHWPVILFVTEDRVPLPPAVLLLIQAALTLAFAALSYRFVEQPIRHQGLAALVPGRPFLGRAAAVASIVAVTSMGFSLIRAGAETGAETGANDAWAATGYEPAETTSSIHLIGNSIPHSLHEGIHASNHPASDLKVSRSTSFGCDPFDYVKLVNGEPVPASPDCAVWQRTWSDEVASLQPALSVIFVSHSLLNDLLIDERPVRFGTPSHTDFMDRAWDQVMDQALQAGSQRVAFVNLACHRVPGQGASDEITRVNDDVLVTELNTQLSRWAASRGVTVFDQFAFLCADGYRSELDGVELYGDYWHFTPESASLVWSWLAPQVQDELKRPSLDQG